MIHMIRHLFDQLLLWCQLEVLQLGAHRGLAVVGVVQGMMVDGEEASLQTEIELREVMLEELIYALQHYVHMIFNATIVRFFFHFTHPLSDWLCESAFRCYVC